MREQFDDFGDDSSRQPGLAGKLVGATVLIILVIAIWGFMSKNNQDNQAASSGNATPAAKPFVVVGKGRLTARPQANRLVSPPPTETGLQALQLDSTRDALLYIPPNYTPDKPAPLVVTLHGATGNANRAINLLRAQAEANGVILLAPPSRADTWDIIADNGFGADIDFINKALSKTFENYAIDRNRIGLAGFSDGASYALSVGLTNGDLFSHILAFSPGFMRPAARYSLPQIYISHGTQDNILPIAYCSRKIVPRLQAEGYAVNYNEFEGEHTLPQKIATDSINWFLAGS